MLHRGKTMKRLYWVLLLICVTGLVACKKQDKPRENTPTPTETVTAEPTAVPVNTATPTSVPTATPTPSVIPEQYSEEALIKKLNYEIEHWGEFEISVWESEETYELERVAADLLSFGELNYTKCVTVFNETGRKSMRLYYLNGEAVGNVYSGSIGKLASHDGKDAFVPYDEPYTEYDEKGQPAFTISGSIKTVRSFDEKGQVVTEWNYYKDSLQSVAEYAYNEKGLVSRKKLTTKQSAVDSFGDYTVNLGTEIVTEYQYDIGPANLTRITVTGSLGESYEIRYGYEKDDSGRLTGWTEQIILNGLQTISDKKYALHYYKNGPVGVYEVNKEGGEAATVFTPGKNLKRKLEYAAGMTEGPILNDLAEIERLQNKVAEETALESVFSSLTGVNPGVYADHFSEDQTKILGISLTGDAVKGESYPDGLNSESFIGDWYRFDGEYLSEYVSKWGSGLEVSIRYNEAGQVTELHHGGADWKFEYDSEGRILKASCKTRVIYYEDWVHDRTYSFSYDHNGKLAQIKGEGTATFDNYGPSSEDRKPMRDKWNYLLKRPGAQESN